MNTPYQVGEDEISIVIIPDTQVMTKHHSHLFQPMTQWIADHASELNVKMVLHLGDVVNDGAYEEHQFRTAEEALRTIYDSGLPILVSPGNHDYDNMLKEDRSLAAFNRYFGVHRYEGRTWFKGTFAPGQAENSYAALDTEAGNLLFISLEFGPRDEVLQWADGILAAHPDRQAFIITHCYMYMFSERTRPGSSYNPKEYAGATGANDGEDLWQKSFRKHPNVVGVFSGHQIPSNLSFRSDVGDHGNVVFQSFQNWQCTEYGGAGRFRVVTYRPSDRRMRLRVFNPNTGQFESGAGCEVETVLSAMGADNAVRFP